MSNMDGRPRGRTRTQRPPKTGLTRRSSSLTALIQRRRSSSRPRRPPSDNMETPSEEGSSFDVVQTLRAPIRSKLRAFRHRLSSGLDRTQSFEEMDMPTPPVILRKMGTDRYYDRIQQTKSDLFTALEFLQEVSSVNAQSPESLSTNATVVLDSLLKLLLLLNEHKRSVGKDEHDAALVYNAVYAALANLLRWSDNNSLGQDTSFLKSLDQLALNLRTAIINLMTACGADQPPRRRPTSSDFQRQNTLPVQAPLACMDDIDTGRPSHSRARATSDASIPPIPPPRKHHGSRHSPQSVDSGFDDILAESASQLSRASALGPSHQQNQGMAVPTRPCNVATQDVDYILSQLNLTTPQSLVRTTSQHSQGCPNGSASPPSSPKTEQRVEETVELTPDGRRVVRRKVITRKVVRTSHSSSSLLEPKLNKDTTDGCPTNLSETTRLIRKESGQCRTHVKEDFVNGTKITEDVTQKVRGSELSAAEVTVRADDEVLLREGTGRYAESELNSRRKQRFQTDESAVSDDDDSSRYGLDSEVNDDEDRTRRKKKRSVVAYMQIVGHTMSTPGPEQTGTPEHKPNPDAYRQSALASYAIMRDKLAEHEQTFRHNSISFSFGSPNVKAKESKLNRQQLQSKNAAVLDESLKNIPRAASDYHELMNLIDASDRITLPRASVTESNNNATEVKTATPELPPRKPSTKPRSAILEEIDVSQHLIRSDHSDDFGPEIRGGSIDALVVHATKPCSSKHDFLFQECFLTTFRTFLTTEDLLDKLIYRYHKFADRQPQSPMVRSASRNAFSLLVRVVDDLSPCEVTPGVLQKVTEFVYSMVYSGELNLPRLLRMKILEKSQDARAAAQQKHANNLSNVVLPTSKSGPCLLDYKAETLAEQMTYLDEMYFQKIEPCEMLWWSQEQAEERTSNLAAFTDHFNRMSFWVRTRIIELPDTKDREKYLTKFIKIMKHLRRMGNFNSYLSVLSALDSSPLRRLGWPKNLVDELRDHATLIDSSQSFKNYRSALSETKPPCLPYLGLILQDLTFVHIGNPPLLPLNHTQGREDMINYAKRWQQFTILDSVRKFKSWPYDIKRNEKIIKYFNNFNDRLSEDAIWELSETIRPRNRQH